MQYTRSEGLLASIGYSYIILAVLSIIGVVDLDSLVITCLSVSGLLFTIGEFAKNDSLINKPSKVLSKLLITNKIIGVGAYFFAIVSIVVLPHLSFLKGKDPIIFTELNNYTVIASLGFIIAMLAKKIEKEKIMHQQEIIRIMDEHQQIKQKLDECIETLSNIKIENDSK